MKNDTLKNAFSYWQEEMKQATESKDDERAWTCLVNLKRLLVEDKRL